MSDKPSIPTISTMWPPRADIPYVGSQGLHTLCQQIWPTWILREADWPPARPKTKTDGDDDDDGDGDDDGDDDGDGDGDGEQFHTKLQS